MFFYYSFTPLIMEVTSIVALASAAKDTGLLNMLAVFILFIAYKYIDKKFFLKDDIKKERKINDELDELEAIESKKQIEAAQEYLQDNIDNFKKMGFDRASIWQNHNGTRKGKFHFLYYSLIAEVVANGLELFSQRIANTERVSHYMFSEYERRAIGSSPHLAQLSELGQTAKNIWEDLWTKTIYVRAIYNTKGWVDWLFLLSSVYNEVEKDPEGIDENINNLRIILRQW